MQEVFNVFRDVLCGIVMDTSEIAKSCYDKVYHLSLFVPLQSTYSAHNFVPATPMIPVLSIPPYAVLMMIIDILMRCALHDDIVVPQE